MHTKKILQILQILHMCIYYINDMNGSDKHKTSMYIYIIHTYTYPIQHTHTPVPVMTQNEQIKNISLTYLCIFPDSL